MRRGNVIARVVSLPELSDQWKRWPAQGCDAACWQEERQTMNAPKLRSRQRKPLVAAVFQPEISSFRLALSAEGKAAKTVRNYTEAVQWFAAAHLIPRTLRTRWEQVSGPDIQWWMVWLLGRSAAATPATSTGRCSSSLSGGPRRKTGPTQWPGCTRLVSALGTVSGWTVTGRGVGSSSVAWDAPRGRDDVYRLWHGGRVGLGSSMPKR